MFAVYDLPPMPIIRALTILFALTAAIQGYAQFGVTEKSAIKNIEKQNWSKARALILKSLAKDSANATARYLYVQWFFNPLNPAFDVDSTSYHLLGATTNFFQLELRERTRLAKVPIDSLVLARMRQRVDSAAFERAKRINTEGGYQQFLFKFPDTRFEAEAKYLRDEAAYNDAVRLNTYQSFLSFLDKYPQAFRAGEARDRYERLFFESKTRERTLDAYESFLSEHPATPYRREVEEHIFNILTAAGGRENFEAFLTRYARSLFAKLARDLLFHIVEEADHANHNGAMINDSLAALSALNRKPLIPFLKDGSFGFMDTKGTTILLNQYATIPDEYLCGNITEDVLILNGQLVNRSGQIIAPDTIQEVDDLGFGFLKVMSKCLFVIHKSGFRFPGCFENAKIISNRFVAVKRNNRWSLQTFTGKPLSDGWDDIKEVNGLVVFEKEKQYFPVTSEQVARSIEKSLDIPSEGFLEIRPWSRNLVFVSNRDGQGILDTNLRLVVPVSQRTLEKTFFGILSKSTDNIEILNSTGQAIESARRVNVSKPWVTVADDSTEQFFDLYSRIAKPEKYDSIAFVGMFAVGHRRDSLTVYFDALTKVAFPSNVSLSFISGRDSTGYLVASEKKQSSVFSPAGKLLFKGEYETIQYAGESLFIVGRKEKRGLVTISGKVLLPLDYDAVGSVNKNIVTFLKSMKFGAYHVTKQKLIKPQFDKNVVRYTDDIVGAFRGGSYNFMDWDGKIIGKLGFDEISYWNDSTALVRNEKLWSLYDIHLKSMQVQNIESVEYVKDADNDKTAIFKLGDVYGVWNDREGIIISPEFSALINVGTEDEPVYFTEKHLEIASLYVVIYYDRNGRLLRREVYEEDDYERILCTD